MAIKQTIPPTAEPVTLESVKQHLRVMHAVEDDLITDLIAVARELVEHHSGRQLMPATYRLTLDRLPSSGEGSITLPKSPVQSVTSVTYVDIDGQTRTLDAGTYAVDTDAHVGSIDLAYGQTWPTSRSQASAVTITFVAGYADAASVPAAAKHAIKLIVGHLYEHREAVTETKLDEMPMAVQSLVNSISTGRY